jgi:quinolinate synthase
VLNEKKNIIDKIFELKEQRNAVILAHNYELGEVQDIADFVGDSLELSQKAAETEADVIVFCGVHFMAETASILSPNKVVILPDTNAGCEMADMINAEQLREKKKELGECTVVCYVNSTAEVKAESDYCCTSANAVKVVNNIKSDTILFVPDKYLGSYAAKISGKNLILWPGFCPTHARITESDIANARKNYPDARVMVHPECRPEVIDASDTVLSTSGMLEYSRTTEAKNIFVGTEIGIIYRLRKENPDKNFMPVSEQSVCPNMKLIDLEKVLQSLLTMKPEIKVPEEIRLRAKLSVDRMLEIV